MWTHLFVPTFQLIPVDQLFLFFFALRSDSFDLHKSYYSIILTIWFHIFAWSKVICMQTVSSGHNTNHPDTGGSFKCIIDECIAWSDWALTLKTNIKKKTEFVWLEVVTQAIYTVQSDCELNLLKNSYIYRNWKAIDHLRLLRQGENNALYIDW